MLKFIGQHIVDLIARFRSDVYLEDISSGTIASGGNLGLDSNNKIVKANEPTSHDAVTLAGTPDYITLSGQEITRNQIDLTADVTGALPVGNGGTGVTSLGSINISSLNNDSGFTTNTGDIDRVRISTSTGNAEVTSGNADFTLSGSTPIGVTNSGTTITVAANDASTSAKGVASFSSSNFSVSSGAVSLSTGQDSNIVKQICCTHHNMSLDGASSTVDYYFPINSLADGSSSSLYYTRVIAAYDGKIVKILFRPSEVMGSSCTIYMSRRAHDGTSTSHQTVGSMQASETFNGSSQSTIVVPCGVGGANAADWVFEEGDMLGFSLVKNTTATNVDLAVTIVYEYTL